MSEEGGSGLNIGFNPQAESPYRKETSKEVTEEVNEQRNFEVCQPKESVIKKGFMGFCFFYGSFCPSFFCR